MELRLRKRDAEQWRAEVEAMNSVTSESTKVLTEKLALAREVAALKPEIEHLRSQVASNQSILAEKLALQREVSTLHVELETERRAVQRTKMNTSKQSDIESKSTNELEALKKELAKERKDAQKTERESRKQAAEWESQKTILDSKLDAFRNKLRTTKEQLKHTQKELEESQASVVAKDRAAQSSQAATGNPRKRQKPHNDPDATMDTPIKNSHLAKRSRQSTVPGDKSTFSITPFLNKTTSILPDTPQSTASGQQEDDQAEGKSEKLGASSPSLSNEHQRSKASAPKPSKKAKQSHSVQPEAKRELPAVKLGKASSKQYSGLTKVVEEGGDENDEAVDKVADLDQTLEPVAANKKKRRILGQRQSLFDEDDEEESKSRSRAVGMLAPSREWGVLRGGGSLATGSLGLARAKGVVLANFSPLKKDRRPPPHIETH